jgi:NADH dehydrogenase FAD-containing subunit
VIGGGFAGASAARTLTTTDSSLAVTLLHPSRTHMLSPGLNLALVGAQPFDSLAVGFAGLRRLGINVVHELALVIDPNRRTVLTSASETLHYDRLIVATGASPRFDAVAGYSDTAAALIPHAWDGRGQAELLKRQIELMPSGGVFLICLPGGPLSGPAAPYERASLIAEWMVVHKPRGKVLIIDPKESFPLRSRFREAWRDRYDTRIELVTGANYRVARIDPRVRRVVTEYGNTFTGDVLNFIPNQIASPLTAAAGLRDSGGFCPVNPRTFESVLRPNVHVIGDCAGLGPVPKTAVTAAAEGRFAAMAVLAMLHDREPEDPTLDSAIGALAALDYGFSTVEAYRIRDGRFVASVTDRDQTAGSLPEAARQQGADGFRAWLSSMMAENWPR